MTNPNNQTNGASLEDCHTNFFALTDLCGIKWRKVVWVGGGGLTDWGEPAPAPPPSDPLEDPVLASYVKCISADMLCVWRRVSTPASRSPGDMFGDLGLGGPPPSQLHQQPPPLSLAATKELWIFWYGEEPDLSSLVSPELLQADGEQGSWESGLSYECRSLLFKALHNLIERCLLSRDFVRIGKWYVQPYDSSEKVLEKSGHYSFAFDFFVHGESQVCASIDVRQHPPIRTLLPSHLQQAALHSQPPVNVILAPFGLAGTLTGQSFRLNDPQTQRLLENWRTFYPIDRGPINSDLPPVVEVIVGGMKLRYPSQYVLLTDMDDSTKSLFTNLDLDNPAKVVHPISRGLNRVGLLAERVWQESLVVLNLSNAPAPAPGGSSGGSGGGGSGANTPMTPGGGGGPPTPGQNPSAQNPPPQSSSPQPGQWNFLDPTRKQPCSCSCNRRRKSRPCGGQCPGAPFHRRAPPTPGQLRLSCGASMGQNDSVPIASVGSPNAPESPTPPSVPPQTDPTMPLLSPQPPQQHHISPSPLLDEKVVSTPIDFNAPKSVPSISNQMLSPYGEEAKALSESVGGPGSVGLGGGKATPITARTPLAAPPPTPPPQPPPQSQPPPTPKRPLLTSSEYEDALTIESRPSNLLYDYSLLEAWLNHPVKKFKPAPPPQLPAAPPILTTFKQEPNLPIPSPMEESSFNGRQGGSDPYDFSEDGLHINSYKRPPPSVVVKEEEKPALLNGTGPSPATPGKLPPTNNLYTSDSLQVSYSDLEQMFNHSDDNSGDETLGVTPPSSNKGPEEAAVNSLTSRLCLNNGGGGGGGVQGVGILRPEELCKMFPTPPSLEHPLPSPGDPDHVTAVSPHHQPIQDWSYVFKPSPMSKFVGSSKYAPLLALPSHSLPPVSLPANSTYKPSWSVQQEKQNSSTSCNRSNSGGGGGTNTPGGGGPRTPSIPALPPATPTGVAAVPSPAPAASWGRAPPPPYSPATQVQYPPPATALPHPHTPPPEANSIVVIVLLSDTAFNIFRDHNFDSCTLCVCNDSPKVVGNIRGSDAGMYLIGGGGGGGGGYSPLSPSPHIPLEEEHIRCNCGFSAVVNRRLSHRAGLFIEDEIEICGVFDETGERETGVCIGRLEMELMSGQCVGINSSSNALVRAATQFRPASPLPIVNLLSLRDSNYISMVALEQGRLAIHHSQSMCKMEEMGGYCRSGTGPVHRWAHMRAKGPPSNQDIVRVMKQLQPLLQEAIQKKCTTRLWEAPTVSGPLTWRQFHRLAGRGTDDRCEPQPIPSLIVGREKDWVTLAPYAIHLWEKLLLEPYSYSRDIAYVVVAPDNDYVLNSVRTFFKELSSMYEVCRLGRHVPITKVLRDGILRVGKTAAVKLAKEPLDDWFSNLSDTYQANMLKLYAQVCRHHLAPHLSQVPFDKTLLDPPEGSNPLPRSTLNSMDQPNTPKPSDSFDDGNSSGCEYSLNAGSSGSGTSLGMDEDGSEPPMIVVYLVEPFTVGADSPELQRLSCVGLLKAFSTVIANVPEQLRSNITLQVISLESILELGRSGDTNCRSDHMRTLAISVFCQARKTMLHTTNNIKALTGFGTAASNEVFLKNKDEKNRAPYKVFTPAYVLAKKSRDKPVAPGSETEGGVPTSDHCNVLYVSYCLSEDQRWLLATATDEQGLLLETISINIHIPNRARRRRASARRAGLQKLMDFMLGVMSQSVTPWRLVVGRVGRIGHGELKGWSWLLSRKSLLKASKNLKEICGQCNLLYPHDVPCILSACLVSLEPDSALRLMPDQFTPDERFSQASVKCALSTPGDVSATHILVFPTSATTQSSQTAFQEQHINVPELGDDDLLSVLNDDELPEGMSDFHDIFSSWPETEGGGVGDGGPDGGGGPGRGGRPDSPSPTPPHSHPHSPYPHSVSRTSGEGSEEVGTLLQQPLALGYLVSTAPTGRMPRWFWSACPHLESVSPPFLKNALHLHSTAVLASSDELLQQQTAIAGHALDSQYTTDVLRYVLEGYNALSWLALDSNTHDRLSCLPVHMQVLMQLYHMTAALA